MHEIDLLRGARPDAPGPRPQLVREAKAELVAVLEGAGAARRRRARRAFAVAVPAVAALAAVVIAGSTLIGRSDESAWAAALVRIAEAAPRLLLDESGWHVTRADQFSADFGEMTFSNGGRELELRWNRGREPAKLVADRAASSDYATTARVVGTEARLFRYEGPPRRNDFTAIWVLGDHVLEARGLASDAESFKAVLASLHEVDVDTWLSAMPETVVKPAARAEVIDEMLAGIPLPAGFEAARLRRGDAVRDRYQLGAQVAGAVACAWIDRWATARRAGDAARVREAVDAMATSRTWPILLEMDEEGDYPEVLWEYADAMETGAPVSGGRPLTVEESYRRALGCQ